MTSPLVSIIIPTRNNADHLPAALDSIRAQRIEPLEVIVVDDGSDIPVADAMRRHWPEAVIVRQANAGPSAARNRGLHQATGEFVAFLDADDLWPTNTLASLLKGFRDAPAADAVQGHVRSFRDAGNSGGSQTVRSQPYLGFNVGALMVRRRTLLDVGVFNEKLWHSEDVDLFMRMHDLGVTRLIIPDVVLHYRRHPASLTGDSAHPAAGHRSAEQWIKLIHQRRVQHRIGVAKTAEDAMPVPSSAADRRISVLMVVRNGRKYLPVALDAIRRQTLPAMEVIAVVGESEDATAEYLEAQDDLRVVRQSGLGLAPARNEALDLARGEFIAFYDHDDLWHRRKLELQMRAIAPFARPAASIANFSLVEDADSADSSAVSGRGRAVTRLGWTPSALLAHREVFREVGPFDPELGLGCDADWFRRMRLNGVPCAVTPGVLLRKRIHGDNLSAEPARNRAAMLQMLRKHRQEMVPGDGSGPQGT